MPRPTAFVLAMTILAACRPSDDADAETGRWVAALDSSVFVEDVEPLLLSDGCEVTIYGFEVQSAGAALLDSEGTLITELGAARYDMLVPGPEEMGSATVSVGTYAMAQFEVAPADTDAMHTWMDITCGGGSVDLDITFDTQTAYVCDVQDLTIPVDGEVTTVFLLRPERLFADALGTPDATLRGQAFVDADADDNNHLEQHELDTMVLTGLGYDSGNATGIATLGSFITALSRELAFTEDGQPCWTVQ